MACNRPFEHSARKIIKGTFCCYCGEPATDDEHFPPLCAVHWGVILPACSECNRFAGTDWWFDFEMRVAGVKEKLVKRYRRCLETPDWSTDEIDDLGRGLRDEVRQWQELKRKIEKRIAWNATSYLSFIDHNNYFAQLIAGISISGKRKQRSSGNFEINRLRRPEPVYSSARNLSIRSALYKRRTRLNYGHELVKWPFR
jgi:hypothetical protein